ncbi:helix-turn-helix domain-containing protein [Nocardia nova]|uniref:helix-turn-helix domain-containing protein n=1 Tax=Nocardia nova TaxID=37330 RepID=UPI0034100CAA
MAVAHLLRQAREAAGLTQTELADAAGTSQPTLSAYEQGQKSPTLDTAARIVDEAGFEFALTPKVEFTETGNSHGRPIMAPTALARLPLEKALATVELPLHLNWSDRGRRYSLRDRRQRARVYEIVLREGTPADILTYIDGVLLVDIWNELVLPPAIRSAWEHVAPALGHADRSVA